MAKRPTQFFGIDNDLVIISGGGFLVIIFIMMAITR